MLKIKLARHAVGCHNALLLKCDLANSDWLTGRQCLSDGKSRSTNQKPPDWLKKSYFLEKQGN